jgi:hypothetical protein
VQRRALEIGIALQQMAQPLRRREDPLPQRQIRQDVIGEVGRRRHHVPGVARRAYGSALAREGDQELVPAPSHQARQAAQQRDNERVRHADNLAPLVGRDELAAAFGNSILAVSRRAHTSPSRSPRKRWSSLALGRGGNLRRRMRCGRRLRR